MAAKALGYVDLTDQECIDLMDEFKEHGALDVWLANPDGTANFVRGVSGRAYLQHFGNQARKVFGDTFWIDQVLPEPSSHPASEVRDIENLNALGSRYRASYLAITDLRYPNEAERVRALGGVVWEVVRPGTASDGHASEQPLPRDLVDLTLQNNGTLDDLADEVRAALGATF